MQTETQRGPLPVQDFPAHLLDNPDVVSNSSRQNIPVSVPPRPEVLPDSLGAIRGAVICLPIAVVMWAIIIAAILHFLIA